MIGTAVGSCMPGPCLPHASVYPSPDTTLNRPSSYRPGRPIVGVSQLHTQGTGGLPSYGNLLVWPSTGPLQIDEADHASPAADQRATATRYDVTLSRYHVGCGVVPARHAALYVIAFAPADAGTVGLDVARKLPAFDTFTPGQAVHMRIAISFKSVDEARMWLYHGVPTYDLDAQRDNAAAAWNDVLGRVTCDGATPDPQRHLYAPLWHAMVQPRGRTDDGSTDDDYYTLWDS